MPLPQTPQPPVQVWTRGIELGVQLYGRLLVFTSPLALLALLPRLDIGLRLGNQPVTLDSLRASLGLRWVVIELVCVVLSLLVQAAIVLRVAQCSAAGAEADKRTVNWRQAVHSWLPLLGAVILCVLVVIFAALVAAMVGGIVAALAKAALGREGTEAIVMLLLFVAVVFVGVYLVLVQFAVVLERKGPLAAIDSSFNLVRNNWWRTFLVLLITGVVLVGVMVLASVPMEIAFGWRGSVQTGRVMLERSVLQMVLSALTAPFIATILYVQYLDLKMRRAAEPPKPTAALQA